jgi:sugar lactone lactonase YvrE
MAGNIMEDNYLYILQVVRPSILRMSKNGGETTVIIDDLVGVPDGIQIDRINGLVYWTNMGIDFNHNDGTVEVAELNGGNRKLLAGNGAVTTPKQLWLDIDEGLLYWCDREGGRIFRCRTDGRELTVLVERERSSDGSVPVPEQCVGITIDKKNKQLYWTQKGPDNGGEGRIFRASIDIPAGENASERSDIEMLMCNLPEPIDLELDETNGYLYWTDRGNSPDGNSLNRAKVGPGGLTEHQILFSGFAEAIGLALDEKNNQSYITDLGGNVHQIDLTSLSHRVIYSSGMLTGIALG